MNRWLMWAVIAVVLAVGGFAGYTALLSKGSSEGQYRTTPVKRTDIAQIITATGTIVPEEVIDVGAQVNGQVSEFGVDTDGKTVDYRSTVEEGAILAKIDESVYAADV